MDQTFYGRRKRNGLKSPWNLCHSHLRMLKLKETPLCTVLSLKTRKILPGNYLITFKLDKAKDSGTSFLKFENVLRLLSAKRKEIQAACMNKDTVRFCLPFPCVSTPLYGPSCFLSLVHSSPSV